MKHKLLSSILVTFTSLAIIGCGGTTSNSPNAQNTEPFSVEKYSSLKTDSNITNITNDDSFKAATQDSYGDTIETPASIVCDSGTVFIDGEEVFANHCTHSGYTLDGNSTYIEVDNGSDPYHLSLKAMSDITFKNTSDKLKIDSNSYLDMNDTKIDDNNSKIDFTFSVSGNINHIDFSFNVDIDLNIHECHFDACASKARLNIKNADIQLGDYAFKLDVDHNNTIAFTEDPTGNEIVNGSIQWVESGTNHDIQISFDEDNKTRIKIDENGDASFSASEIIEL